MSQQLSFQGFLLLSNLLSSGEIFLGINLISPTH
jgi:hypothetical protein